MSLDAADLLPLAPGQPRAFPRFCHAFLGWTPHPKQVAYGEADARTLFAICGIRFGKSAMAAARFLHRMFYGSDHRYLAAAFSQDQANIVVEQAAAMAYAGSLSGWVRDYKRQPHPTLRLKNGATLQARSTDDADLLRGRAYHGINVDEAAYARRDDVDVLRGRTIDYGGWLSVTTTPKGKNWVFPLYLRAMAEQASGNGRYFAQTGTTWDNPVIPRSEIERIREEYPDRSYRQEILGEFVDLEGATFPPEVLDRVFQTGLTCETEPRPGCLYVVGWDLGRKTTRTVGTVIECSSDPLRVVASIQLSSAPWPTIFAAINDTSRRWNANTIIDSTGVGDVVYQSVNVSVEPFIFTARSRAELITELQSVAHRPNGLLIPREICGDLYAQMQLHTWQEDAEGQTWDEFDSLMLAVHHARETTFRGPALIRIR